MKALRNLLVTIVLLCSTSCGIATLKFPDYTYVRLNDANPVRTIKKLHIPPPVWQTAQIDDQEQAGWLAAHSPGQRASFTEDMRRFELAMQEGVDRFHTRWSPHIALAAGPSADAHTLAVKVETIRLGWFAGTFFSGATYVTYAVELKDPEGQVVESFTSREEVPNGLASGTRLVYAGRGVGIALEHYLKARTRGHTQAGP